MELPHFVIKNNFQKGGLYQHLLTPSILSDVCQKVTGQEEYTSDFDNTGYNKGRLAVLDYKGKTTYISFSEVKIRGRNSSFQSFSSALSRFILEKNPNKEICFYFLSSISGRFETPYFIFMYRLMKTVKVNFLNERKHLNQKIFPFTTPVDIIAQKDIIRSKNSGNKSTYITHGSNNKLQIFGKTYGASKYETTLLCLAISEIATSKVELYEIEEGGLTKLPHKSKKSIESLGVVKIFTSNKTIEKEEFEKNNSLRSIKYTYNLLSKLGDKKCAFCECRIPQIIQGAHIWAVADIKKEAQLTLYEKLNFALDGENGLWLCQNHHKLLDTNILKISMQGFLKYKSTLNKSSRDYIQNITTNNQLNDAVFTNRVAEFLKKRNEGTRGEFDNVTTYERLHK